MNVLRAGGFALFLGLLIAVCLGDTLPTTDQVTLDLNSTTPTPVSAPEVFSGATQPNTEPNAEETQITTENSIPVTEAVASESTAKVDHPIAPSETSEPWQAVVQSSNQFALNLYKVVKSDDDPVLISPLSVGVLLNMLWLGSAGKTAMQIAQALNLPENRSDVTDGFHQLFQSLEKQVKNNITLDIASKLYADHMFLLNEDFHNTIRKSFLADAELLNFVADPDLARTAINSWVEEQTQSRIKELIQKGVVNIDTKVVLVNAVYFKGFWKNQFVKEFTREMPFYLLNGTKSSTPSMLAIGDFPTATIQHLNSTVIKLPYEGSVSMLIFLPRSQQGLPDLEENLRLQDIQEVIPRLEDVELHLYFPKFNLVFSSELEEAFKKLGINDIFANNANLSGISPITGLSVTHVLHKTFLEVTEEGSEASAASAAALDIRGGTLSINVDHPFMFAIYDDSTGSILFLGNYRGPK